MLCSRVQNQLSAYSDGELTGVEMLEIRQHLDACDTCRQEHEQLVRVKRLFSALADAQPPRQFDPDILDRAPRPRYSWFRTHVLSRCEDAWYTLEDRAFGAFFAARDCVRAWLARPAQVRRGLANCATAAVLASCAFMAGALQRPQHADAVNARLSEAIAVGQVEDPGVAVFAGTRVLRPVSRETVSPLPPAYIHPGEGTPIDRSDLPVAASAPPLRALVPDRDVRTLYPADPAFPGEEELPVTRPFRRLPAERVTLVRYQGSGFGSFSR